MEWNYDTEPSDQRFAEMIGHEGSLVGLVPRHSGDTEPNQFRELCYPDDSGDKAVSFYQVSCLCGWRSKRFKASRPARWHSYALDLRDGRAEQEAHALWRTHCQFDLVKGKARPTQRRPQPRERQDNNAAAYIRVSSKAQTLDMQRAAIQQAAQARGDRITTWYAEKQSAKTIARPALTRLRTDARAGQVRRLYIFRLDRLARSGIRDTFEVVEELRGAGCELVTISDGFDLTGPAGEVVLAVMAWAAKMERLAINERIAAARTRLESEGRAWGRPSVMTDEARSRVLQLHRAGHSIRSIAATLQLNRSAVFRSIAVSRKHGSPSSGKVIKNGRKTTARAERRHKTRK